MLTREQAIALINTEREYQDTTYSPDQLKDSGLTRAQRDLDVTPHLVLLSGYVRKAEEAWITPGSNVPALQQIAKIAAIAIRALERCGNSEKLLEVGLR